MALDPKYESSETDTTIYSKLSFDLSDIIQKLQNEEYKTGDNIKSPELSVGDYIATLTVCPTGSKEKDAGHWSVYLTILPKSNIASVEFIIYCDSKKLSLKGPIQRFKGGLGWGNAFERETVFSSDSKCFIVEIKIFDEDNQLAKPYNFNQSYSKQQELIYKNSKENGDIILVIRQQQVSIESQPERKKKKNVNNTNNCSIEEGADTEMKVSSVILRSASTVFAGMFGHTFVENNDKQIIIQTINKQDVDDMYYYICTNQLRESVNPNTLIKLAHLYDLTSLFNACSNRIIVELSIHNFVESANTFNRYGIENNYEKLITFGKENLKEIKKQSNFDDLSFAFKFGVLRCGSP